MDSIIILINSCTQLEKEDNQQNKSQKIMGFQFFRNVVIVEWCSLTTQCTCSIKVFTLKVIRSNVHYAELNAERNTCSRPMSSLRIIVLKQRLPPEFTNPLMPKTYPLLFQF